MIGKHNGDGPLKGKKPHPSYRVRRAILQDMECSQSSTSDMIALLLSLALKFVDNFNKYCTGARCVCFQFALLHFAQLSHQETSLYLSNSFVLIVMFEDVCMVYSCLPYSKQVGKTTV